MAQGSLCWFRKDATICHPERKDAAMCHPERRDATRHLLRATVNTALFVSSFLDPLRNTRDNLLAQKDQRRNHIHVLIISPILSPAGFLAGLLTQDLLFPSPALGNPESPVIFPA
jgi:hypothetical protein